MQRPEIQDLGRKLNFFSSFATQKGVTYFKSTTMPFFNNSGTVGPRKLKFGIQVGNQICMINSATQKGMAYSKSAAKPFFYNSGTVGPRKLKFGIQVGNQI